MNSTIPEPREALRILASHWRRCLVPMLIVAVLAAACAVVIPPTWQASQALILRNEATNAEIGPGKFARTDEMKTLQETILELAKSRGVLTAALEETGAPADYAGGDAWPSETSVDGLRETVKIVPPKGAEFGATEVFYLHVRDRDRGRAIRLNLAICDQLQTRFQQLRDAKAQSMIDELEKAARLAKADLDEATGRLTVIENQVGSDLGELRILQESTGGESILRRTVTEIENELRQMQVAEKSSDQLLALLQAARTDPGQVLATPSRLLEALPAIKRLKDGLLDAQIHTATLQGRMSAEHPLVQAAKEAEQEIGVRLHRELALAVNGLHGEQKLIKTRITMLEGQRAAANARLSRLAGLRAAYTNHVTETNHRAKLLDKAQQNLAEARATRASAKAASLISRIDVPDAGIRPVGPSRAMIILAGIAGGFIVGLGVVFLTAQSTKPESAETAGGSASVAEDNGAADDSSPRPAPATDAVPLPDFAFDGRLSLKQALTKITRGNGKAR